jgi:crotonobetainyl-CoA:carnitine CoA-transferase CaiB-like acyl-CoA transferase
MNDIAVIDAFLHAMHPPSPSGAADDCIVPAVLASGSLPSAFPVTALAVASIGAAGQALAGYMATGFGQRPAVAVDRRLASFWFETTLRPVHWAVPDVRDPITGDYACRDGWIRLHANAPHHRAAALSVLKQPPDHERVGRAIAERDAAELETAIVRAGGCAAVMRSTEAWATHPQGMALATEPLFHVEETNGDFTPHISANPNRPLDGLKVLDLTRVLAGPVSTRFLAGFGAQVLRIDPPFWDEPGMIPEVTLGKRCAALDLRIPEQLERLKALLGQADVLVHGYRSDALARIGLGAEARQTLRPGLVDVALDAYGWSGPWKTRRGFDSLVQMSCGIAHAGMLHYGRDRPTPLPVQALDHATGYLLACAALSGLRYRLSTGRGSRTRLSLARTAALLMSQPALDLTPLAPERGADSSSKIEHTDWGPARRLRPPCELEGIAMQWERPACALRSAQAKWER